jgi:membrane protein DedA with SNARE-associated domain
MDQLVDLMLGFYAGPMPYLIVLLILLACGLGLPIPEDITLFAAGLVAYYGVSSVWGMVLISFIGIMVGDSMIYYLGWKYGRRLTKFRFFNRFLTEDRLKVVQTKFHSLGNRLIFAARFMPGLRAPVFFSAGLLHLPFRVFFFYDGLAALISVPTIILVVYFFGDQIDLVIKRVQSVEHGILAVIAAVVLFVAVKWYLAKRRAQPAA